MKAFIATVPFTIIEAVNYVVSENIDDADIYLVNVFNDAREIYENIKKTDVFKNAYFVEDVLLTYPITLKKCFKVIKNGRKFIRDNKKRKYDAVYYNNSGWLINSVFYTAFRKGNKNLENNFIEHGFYSYTNDYSQKPWYMRHLVHLFGMRCMDGSMLDNLYMFHPEIMSMPTSANICKMKKMDKTNKRLVNSLNTIFGYSPEQDEFSEKKIIIMEQGPQKYEFDKDGFWNRILKMIDKDNAIVKAHPRQKQSSLIDKGVAVCTNHTVPWEIELLNMDINDKVQMTIFSGSCISPKLLFDEEPTVIFLYKIAPIDQSVWGEGVTAFADSLGEMYRDKSKYFVPNSWEEFDAYLKK